MKCIEKYSISGQPGSKEVLFLALGGLGAIGMNFYLYGHKGKWLIVDFGVGFAGDSVPGVDVLVADPAFIAERREDIVGLILTHAHEDHVGALAYTYKSLGCRVYATPFTAGVAAYKLREAGCVPNNIICTIPEGGKITLGPFSLQYIRLTHSIVESQGLCIGTDIGTIFHTGDWKFDEDPLIGSISDTKNLREIGKKGVLALVGDSTNVLTKQRTQSEAEIRQGLCNVIASKKGIVAVTCFASNIARVESIIFAAQKNNRKVALCGRSLWRMVACARDVGYLKNCPNLYEAQDVCDLPSDQVLYICTGSQGEGRAALARIARNDYPHVRLKTGDTVIFSARAIPANQTRIATIQSKIIALGVHIITPTDALVHASGHGARDEMSAMYHMVKPRFAIPMHGESLHLVRHAQLAEDHHVKKAMVLENGAMVSITKQDMERVDDVYTSIFAVDGDHLIEIDGACLKERRKIAFGGLVFLTVVIDDKGRLRSKPQITMEGVHVSKKSGQNGLDGIVEEIFAFVEKGSDHNSIKRILRSRLRKHLFDLTGKKVPIKIHLMRS